MAWLNSAPPKPCPETEMPARSNGFRCCSRQAGTVRSSQRLPAVIGDPGPMAVLLDKCLPIGIAPGIQISPFPGRSNQFVEKPIQCCLRHFTFDDLKIVRLWLCSRGSRGHFQSKWCNSGPSVDSHMPWRLLQHARSRPLRHHPFKPAPSRFYLAGAEPTTVDDTAPLAEVSNRVHGGLMPDCPATAKGSRLAMPLGSNATVKPANRRFGPAHQSDAARTLVPARSSPPDLGITKLS